MYHYIAARIAAMSLMFINLRCEYRILDVRSKPLLAFCCVMGVVINELGRFAGTPEAFMLMFANPLVTFVAPVALSRGPLFKRVARVAIICLCSLFSEFACTVVYLLLEHETKYTTVDASNFPSIVITYMAGSILNVLIMEFLIAHLHDSRTRWEREFTVPILAFIVGNYLFLMGAVHRFSQTESQSMAIPLAMLVISALDLILAYVLHRLLRIERRLAAQAAGRAATLRQTRHIREQIEGSASRVMEMRQLRHDLANQMGVVVELAQTGHEEEADRYLAELIERSDELLGAPRE